MKYIVSRTPLKPILRSKVSALGTTTPNRYCTFRELYANWCVTEFNRQDKYHKCVIYLYQGRILKRMGMPPWVKWAMTQKPANTTTDEPTDSVVDEAETPPMPVTAIQEVLFSHPHSRTLLPCYIHPISCFGHIGGRQSRNTGFRTAKVNRS